LDFENVILFKQILLLSIRERSRGLHTGRLLGYSLLTSQMTDTYSLDTPYISIFDKKPKKKRQSLYTEEEKIQKHRDNAVRYRINNYEYCTLQQRLVKEAQRIAKKNKD
jgi:hypothetical protein